MRNWATDARGWSTLLLGLALAGLTFVGLGYFTTLGPAEDTKRELTALVPAFDALHEADRVGLVRAAIRCPGLRGAEFESCLREKADNEFKARLQVLLDSSTLKY